MRGGGKGRRQCQYATASTANTPDAARVGHNQRLHCGFVSAGGEVCGNLDCADRVEIRKGGSLTGNLAAYRISIEDGAFLNGAVDVRTPIEKGMAEANREPDSELDQAEFTPVAELQLAGD